MTGALVIGLALAALVALSWRGVALMLLAPVLAVAAAGLAEGAPLLAVLTQVYMPALGGFVVAFFPLFLLGAVFGRLVAASGAAQVLADAIVARLGPGRAIPAVVLACAALTYGGVSLFVVAFAVWPMAAALFARAGLAARLVPATIALGAFTLTMTALPGTPAIQNAIPMPHFGTTLWAAPGLGLIAAAIMLGLGLAWLGWRARRLAAAGEAPPDPAALPAAAAGAVPAGVEPPAAAAAAAPLVAVLGLTLVLGHAVLPRLDAAYLAEPRWGATTLAAVQGLWAVIAALAGAILAAALIFRRQLQGRLADTLEAGARDCLVPLFNTASLVGFGAVIAGLAAFGAVRDWVVAAGGDNPLVSLAVGASLLAGITGSASGGLSIALDALGPTWAAMGAAAGIAPELMHRVAVLATGGLDALPHNGAVITLLAICGQTHGRAYGDIFMVAVAGPVAALVAVVALGTAFGSF